jgi:hypothetical protein
MIVGRKSINNIHMKHNNEKKKKKGLHLVYIDVVINVSEIYT